MQILLSGFNKQSFFHTFQQKSDTGVVESIGENVELIAAADVQQKDDNLPRPIGSSEYIDRNNNNG